MIIQSAIYTENNAGIRVTQAEGLTLDIPIAEGNKDYREVTEWAKIDGNLIEPYVEPPEPFQPLSRPAFMFMAKKLGMTKQSMLDLVAATMTGDQRAIAEAVIEDQQVFHRDNQLLNALVASIPSLTTEIVDKAWRTAEAIKW